MRYCVSDRTGVFEEIYFAKWGKWTINSRKVGFFEFIVKFGHKSFLNLGSNESLY